MADRFRRLYGLLMVSLYQAGSSQIPHVSLVPRLYGATLSQTLFYFRTFPGDSRAIKCLVSALLVICLKSEVQLI
jgi:hypothetical protein